MEHTKWNRGGQIVNYDKLPQELESQIPIQNENDDLPDKVGDFNKLRDILSRSNTRDAYCRSVLYFVFTGRGIVWTVKHGDNYLVLLPHPNIIGSLLVFFPFATDASELVEQVKALCNCKSFLKEFQEVLLARIPESIAEEALKKAARLHNSLCCKLEIVNETKLDWGYPSYDVQLQKLINPQGGKLKTYRKKIRKFCDLSIEVIRPKDLDQQELRKAVIQINKNWIRAKSRGGSSLQGRSISLRELIGPYQTLARLNSDITLAIDGLILKRGGAYVAFSFWERPSSGDIVSCFAALPCSYEKGLSEYLYYCIANCLKSEGYNSMCIGGSETASLDQFKQKLSPTDTHRLHTIKLSPQNQDSNPLSLTEFRY